MKTQNQRTERRNTQAGRGILVSSLLLIVAAAAILIIGYRMDSAKDPTVEVTAAEETAIISEGLEKPEMAATSEEPAPEKVVLVSHFFTSKVTDEDLIRLTEILPIRSVRRETDHRLVIDTDGADLKAELEDYLRNRIVQMCGQPGYSHVLDISMDENCVASEITVNGLDMTWDEMQLVTDIKLCSLLYAVLNGYNEADIKVTTINSSGAVLRVTNLIG